MNGQILTRIEDLERDVKRMKNLVKQKSKKKIYIASRYKKRCDVIASDYKSSQKLSLMKNTWKKLKITDEELEEAKKSAFNFDVGKYL